MKATLRKILCVLCVLTILPLPVAFANSEGYEDQYGIGTDDQIFIDPEEVDPGEQLRLNGYYHPDTNTVCKLLGINIDASSTASVIVPSYSLQGQALSINGIPSPCKLRPDGDYTFETISFYTADNFKQQLSIYDTSAVTIERLPDAATQCQRLLGYDYDSNSQRKSTETILKEFEELGELLGTADESVRKELEEEFAVYGNFQNASSESLTQGRLMYNGCALLHEVRATLTDDIWTNSDRDTAGEARKAIVALGNSELNMTVKDALANAGDTAGADFWEADHAWARWAAEKNYSAEKALELQGKTFTISDGLGNENEIIIEKVTKYDPWAYVPPLEQKPTQTSTLDPVPAPEE